MVIINTLLLCQCNDTLNYSLQVIPEWFHNVPSAMQARLLFSRALKECRNIWSYEASKLTFLILMINIDLCLSCSHGPVKRLRAASGLVNNAVVFYDRSTQNNHCLIGLSDKPSRACSGDRSVVIPP